MGCTGCKGGKLGHTAFPLKEDPDVDEDAKQKHVSVCASQNEEYEALMHFLLQVPLFKRLPRHQHPLVAGACSQQTFAAGDVIVRQGDVGAELFVIRSGIASVLVKSEDGVTDEEVTLLGSGDYFGEAALFQNEPRRATVKAAEELCCLTIAEDKLRELGLAPHLQFGRRKAVGDLRRSSMVQKRLPTKKTEEERILILEALRKNSVLQAVVTLDEARMQELVNACWRETVTAGTEIIAQGDPVANYFYIVQEGCFEVILNEGLPEAPDTPAHYCEPASPSSASTSLGLYSMQTAKFIERGGSFGELALLYSLPRAATVRACRDSKVFVFDRRSFKSILMKISEGKMEEYVKYLGHVRILNSLLQGEKQAIAQAMIEMHFVNSDVIIRQGEPGYTFYILFDGEVAVLRDGVRVGTLKASLERKVAQYFGERALMRNEPRHATVQVISPTAKAMVLDKLSFEALLGPLEDRLKYSWYLCLPPCWNFFRKAVGQKDRPRKSSQELALALVEHQHTGEHEKCRTIVLQSELVRVGYLGSGAFGCVDLWEHKHTGETYALKSVSKGYIVKMHLKQSIMTEKLILTMTDSPFLIKLHETYNNRDTLSFLLEPALGGELHEIYSRLHFYGSHPHATYYSASVVFAFEHLHERRIIYRDLKPENLLLNHQGHLKVTDFGLSKFVIGQTFTTCGTPDYFAPELIRSVGHTVALDWWTLGILIYELLAGYPPFQGHTPMKLHTAVLKGISKVKFSQHVKGPVESLVRALLHPDPSDRLPMRPGGVQNLKEHTWFRSMCWDLLQTQQLKAPYIPSVKSKTDLANFFEEEERLPCISYKDDGTAWDVDFASA